MRNCNFVGVFTLGGIIDHIDCYETLEEGIKKMDKECIYNRFDPDKDDARIFSLVKHETEVYSFDHDKYVDELNS